MPALSARHPRYLAGLLLLSAQAVVPAGAFSIGTHGCPMAHCDAQMTDDSRLNPPTVAVDIVWRRDRERESLKGLGCSANGTVAVCTFSGGRRDNLVVYDYFGRRLWTSGTHLNGSAYASAPMVAPDGSIIAADDTHLIKFDPSGNIVWKTSHAGGTPISPVLTDGGQIVLAGIGGPVSLYDSGSGQLLDRVLLGKDEFLVFQTFNTPCRTGDRLYISTQKLGENPENLGRLYALDVAEDKLEEAWHFEFGASSGASPLCLGDMVFFDGDRPLPAPGDEIDPTLFAVRDYGSHPELVWSHSLISGKSVRASFARDPRGGFWAYSGGDEHLLRFDQATGQILQNINVDALIDQGRLHKAGSAMTIGGTDEKPVMIVSAWPRYGGRPYVVAIDLIRERLLWQIPIADFYLPKIAEHSTAGQFPLLRRNGKTRVVFSTYDMGVFAIGTRFRRDDAQPQ